MDLFSLISEERVATEPGKKVIKAKDFSTLKKASEILKKLKNEEIVYRKKVAEECEESKKNAYDMGYGEGLNKLNEQIAALEIKLGGIEKDLLNKIIPLTIKAIKKIIGEEIKLHPDRIVDIVIQAIKPVIQHSNIKIYVNAQDIEALEKNKSKIKTMVENVKSFSIIERDDVQPGGCIIETEAGIINAGLETQLRALESAFEKIAGKK